MFYLYLYLLICFLVWIYGRANYNNKKIKSIVILSGDFDWDTRKRTLTGIKLHQKNTQATLIICGKYKSKLMAEILRSFGIKNFIIQKKSTNTYEDGLFLNKISKKILFPMLLVTSQPHSRRAFHTFQRIFPSQEIYFLPTNDLLSIYSSLLPTGWLIAAMNITKDWKYNGKIA